MEAVETMILKDDAEKQIVLNRGLLIKTFSVSVYNKNPLAHCFIRILAKQ